MTDFEEGPEREIFAYIYGHFSLLLEAGSEEDPNMEEGVRFIFENTPPNSSPPGFSEMLKALDPSIRPDLLRLRLMYELWFVGWRIPPLPFNAVPVPGFLKDMMRNKFRSNTERIFREGAWSLEEAYVLMEELWENPGSEPAELYNRIRQYHPMEPEIFSKILLFLVDIRMVSENRRRKISLRRFNYNSTDFTDLPASRLYLTGENPVKLVEEARQDRFRNLNISFFDCFKFVAY